MPVIAEAKWDSDRLGLSVGKLVRATELPGTAELRRFEHVVARVPLAESELVARYEQLGFRFVTIDYALELRKPAAPGGAAGAIRVARQPPPFPIQGFEVAGSRFAIDPALRRRLPPGFWDRMIADHCANFADFCFGIAGPDGALAGFASCLETETAVDIFLLVVHPGATGRGLGARLVGEAAAAANARGKALTTNVVSQNLPAMRFYFRSGFLPVDGEIVLHYFSNPAGP
jgi:GNAT superfamily N-acetyltransferase